MNCVFCRIFDGKIPAKVVARNREALAILDAFPLAIGHTLVISKSHNSKIQDLASEESQGVFELACKVAPAVEKATGAPSTIIAVHNGKEAGQEIPHVHVHIIPRKPGDGAGPVHSMFLERPKSGSMDMDTICGDIASHIS
ncbi:MAG: HIT family protein [Nitrososphaera sp.]